MSKLYLRISYNFTFTILSLLMVLSSCDTTVKTDKAEVGEAIQKKNKVTPSHTFVIDTAKSEITWIGAKMTGRHNGYFKIREGELHMNNGLLSDGHIVIDMINMRSNDKTIDERSNEKLTRHLRSADFFDVEKFPTAVFELTGVAPFDSTKAREASSKVVSAADEALIVKHPTHQVTGNLTIKETTKSVSFPAKVTMEDDLLKAKANFNIDRTEWGLVYRSDKSLGNQTIYPEVNIGFDIVTKPQSE